jgi:membrane protein DedA with SNARE-associated domain
MPKFRYKKIPERLSCPSTDKPRERLKEKAPLLIVISVVTVVLLIVSIDTLEDVLVDGGSFSGTPFAVLLNAIVVFTQNVTATVQSLSYAGIFVLMFLESCSLPIPSEVILPFAGYLVSLGQLNLWLAIFVATIAGVLGSLVDYHIGMKGVSLLTRQKASQRLLFSQAQMLTVQRWFNKYGSIAVFLSRLAPGFRTLVSFPAGAVRMSLTKFVAYTTAGCLAWDAILIYVGLVIGVNWREVAGVTRYIIMGVVIAAIVGLAVYLIKRRRKNKKEIF